MAQDQSRQQPKTPDPLPPFAGFERPTSNYFKMPTNWTDITARINNLAEVKVVEYILRHTWGYQEYGLKKHITIDEFIHGRRRRDGSRMDEGTRLSERGVRYGLDNGVRDGFILEETDDSDRGRIKKFYSLKMRPDEALEDNSQDLHPGVQSLHPHLQDLPPRGAKSAPRSEKDTLERNLQISKDRLVSQNVDNSESGEDSTLRPVSTGVRKKRAGELTPVGAIVADKTFRRPAEGVTEARQVILEYIDDFARELGDEAKLTASVTRAVNLYDQSGLEMGEFTSLLHQARSKTKEYTASIKKRQTSDGGGYAAKNKMPYFFSILENLLGLKEESDRRTGNRGLANRPGSG